MASALNDSRLSSLKAETATHHSMDSADQNYPFSHGIWCRKQKRRYILLKDKIQSIHISHVLQWTLSIYGKRGTSRTPDNHCLSNNFPLATPAYRRITISVVPPCIWTTPELTGNTPELYQCKGAMWQNQTTPPTSLKHQMRSKSQRGRWEELHFSVPQGKIF